MELFSKKIKQLLSCMYDMVSLSLFLSFLVFTVSGLETMSL